MVDTPMLIEAINFPYYLLSNMKILSNFDIVKFSMRIEEVILPLVDVATLSLLFER